MANADVNGSVNPNALALCRNLGVSLQRGVQLVDSLDTTVAVLMAQKDVDAANMQTLRQGIPSFGTWVHAFTAHVWLTICFYPFR